LPLNPPKGAQKRKTQYGRFSSKIALRLKKSATKFIRVKTFSGKVVGHSLAQLSMQKRLAGNVAFYLKFWVNVTALGQNRRFSIYFRL